MGQPLSCLQSEAFQKSEVKYLDSFVTVMQVPCLYLARGYPNK